MHWLDLSSAMKDAQTAVQKKSRAITCAVRCALVAAAPMNSGNKKPRG
jgi:hypothetical protein